MAYIVLVINDNSTDSIAQLNDRVSADAHNPHYALQQVDNLLQKIKSGSYAGGTLQVTTRDTDPGVSTSGTGSQQTTYTLA